VVRTGVWWRDLKESDHLEESGEDRNIILKEVFKKWDGGL